MAVGDVHTRDKKHREGGGSGVCREPLSCFSHKNAVHSPARLAFSLPGALRHILFLLGIR